MKKLPKIIALTLLISGSQLFAQESTKITEKKVEISDVNENALIVKINRASMKDIQKGFKAELKKRSKDVKTSGKEMIANAAMFESISTQEIKVFAQVEKLNEYDHELRVIFLSGETPVTSNKNPSGYKAAESFLYDFANKLSKNANANFLKSEKKALKSLDKDLKKLNKKVKKADKNISKAESYISKNKKTAEKLEGEKNLDAKGIDKRANAEKDVLKDQEKIVKLKKEKEALEKNIKDLEKDKKKKEKEVKSAEKAYEVYK